MSTQLKRALGKVYSYSSQLIFNDDTPARIHQGCWAVVRGDNGQSGQRGQRFTQ